MPFRYPLIIIASLALLGSTAWAQPSLATPSQYQQATPEPAPEPAPRVSRFSMGLNFFGGALDNPENEFDVGDLSGFGMYARYRPRASVTSSRIALSPCLWHLYRPTYTARVKP